MTKRLLLDVNALLALGWRNHPFHGVVKKRLMESSTSWGTCAIVQLGFLRPSMNPSAMAPNSAASAAQAHTLLSRLVSDSEHQYVDNAPEPAQSMAFARLLGHNQVNDQHLIEIARANDCLLLTADKSLIQHFPALVAPLET
jgi:uncharacterized protein